MSVKDVVDSQIQNARICRSRYVTMSEVGWLVGGIVFSLKHSMSVISDPAQFSQQACAYVQELENAGQQEAAVKVSAWIDQLPQRHDLFAA
ncbi:hypothetical protein A7J50_1336 [Pseudomonas antarctica]|uniref:Uncharacterized protein n=1 Tax=Pseudomonas antarctica TaxID=219572 RepID=A0A172YX80_9PSED|nr:hypothetical protein [Pseudomonas antarctica]ANF84770.1 hypothetical protein A7J50_1336 [Pseudomonas antarctica]